MDELGLERRERDGHGRGHGRFEGRHRDDQGHGGRQVGVRPGHVTGVPKQPMTVWYKPDSSWKTAKVHYQANGKWTGSAQRMTLYRNGWYRYTIPDTAGGQVRMAFTDGGSAWDNNGGQGKDSG